MEDREETYYYGLFEAFAWENAQHLDGVSRHPISHYMGEGLNIEFSLAKFFQLEADADDGGIFYWAYEVVDDDFFLVMYCTEADGARSWQDSEDGPDMPPEGIVAAFGKFTAYQKAKLDGLWAGL